jgi:putative transposase
MRRSQFNEERIIAILKEAEAGKAIGELCREHGIADQTYYRWKAKYGGLELSPNLCTIPTPSFGNSGKT